MAKVFDNGDVSSQAPVHTAALVTNQHTSADRCPARVRGAAVRTHLRSRPLPGHPQRRRGRSPLGQRGGRPPPRAAPRRPAAALRSPRPLRGPGRSCRKQRKPCPPGEGRPAPRPGAPLRSVAEPLGERKPARRREWTGVLKGAAARSSRVCNRDTR